MDPELPSAGDAIPRDRQVIEVRVAELRQLFNAIDPSPFREQRPRSPRRGVHCGLEPRFSGRRAARAACPFGSGPGPV